MNKEQNTSKKLIKNMAQILNKVEIEDENVQKSIDDIINMANELKCDDLNFQSNND